MLGDCATLVWSYGRFAFPDADDASGAGGKATAAARDDSEAGAEYNPRRRTRHATSVIKVSRPVFGIPAGRYRARQGSNLSIQSVRLSLTFKSRRVYPRLFRSVKKKFRGGGL